MKTLILAAVAAVGFASTASAADFDSNVLTTTVETGILEFSASTGVDSNLNGFGDDFMVGAKATVLSFGDADVAVYGAIAEVAGDELSVLGAEVVMTYGALELTGDAAYVMVDDFDNGELVLTPSAEFTIPVAYDLDLFVGAGYSWNATDDFAKLGGYGEVGVDVMITETLSIRPSVVMPFDTDNDDLSAAMEVTFSF